MGIERRQSPDSRNRVNEVLQTSQLKCFFYWNVRKFSKGVNSSEIKDATQVEVVILCWIVFTVNKYWCVALEKCGADISVYMLIKYTDLADVYVDLVTDI